VAIWVQQSAEQGQSLAMIKWADTFESRVGARTATDPGKTRDVRARALFAEFKTGQNNLRITSRRSAMVSEALKKSRTRLQKTIQSA
jgi:hypothetical protein